MPAWDPVSPDAQTVRYEAPLVLWLSHHRAETEINDYDEEMNYAALCL
jgi:hypothetical protein